ncbi:MAG: hypothetical protein Kow0022_15360 [Phycisphaerales bacterium]
MLFRLTGLHGRLSVMPRTFRRSARTDLSRKRCLRCGFDGPQLQTLDNAYFCPQCGQDLYARPPRSYLELEDLIRTDRPLGERATPWRRLLLWIRTVFGYIRFG